MSALLSVLLAISAPSPDALAPELAAALLYLMDEDEDATPEVPIL